MNSTKTLGWACAALSLAGGIVLATAEDAGGSKAQTPAQTTLWNEPPKSLKLPAIVADKPKPKSKPKPKPKKIHRAETHTSRVAPKPRKKVAPKTAPKPVAGITISSYAWCPGNAQACIDRKLLTGYNGKYLAGHNWAGWQWLSRVATGTTIRITSGPLAGTYRVYGHLRLNHQGGSFPNTAGADLVLQSCESSGTGFSLAKRV